jgi:hypothetical protein
VGGGGGGGSTISEKLGNHLPCQPMIAAQLLENGGNIEPYTYYNNHEKFFLKYLKIKSYFLAPNEIV